MALRVQLMGRVFSSFSSVLVAASTGARRASTVVASTAVDSSSLSTTSRAVEPTRQLRIYNSLSRTKEAVVARHPLTQPLSWYQCGPTVYDSAHLGHARTYVSFDILLRIMSDYCNLPVSMAMGITDIDDKIVNRAARVGMDFRAWSRHFEAEFLADMRALDVRPASVYLRVSEHLPDIVAFVTRLESLGMAYRGASTGSCYFDSAAFSRAGHVAHKLRASLRLDHHDSDRASSPPHLSVEVESDTYGSEKKSPQDFVLWKVRRPISASGADTTAAPHASTSVDQWRDAKSDPVWPSPWGWGRPGWHIECSSQIQSVFGSSLDLHSGGIDLQFPHHDNEVHQCEAHTNVAGQSWCRIFMHTGSDRSNEELVGHLYIQGRKMSKSLKNFVSIQDFFDSGHSKEQFRMICLLQHYRANIDYSNELIAAASASLKAFHAFFDIAFSHLKNARAARDAQSAAIDRTIVERARLEDDASAPAELLHSVSTEAPSASGGFADIPMRRHERERELARAFDACRVSIDESLLDDFDTPAVVRAIHKLISASHAYFRAATQVTNIVNVELVASVVHFVARILDLLGLTVFASHSAVSAHYAPAIVASSPIASHSGINNLNTELHLNSQRTLDALLGFRRTVRSAALTLKSTDTTTMAARKSLLDACDRLRDETLVELGVWMQDQKDGLMDVQILGVEQARARRQLHTRSQSTAPTKKQPAL